MSRVAFLGTGLIGRAMAERALEEGHEVSVWNRTADKALPLGVLGARVGQSVADAVRGAEHVHVVVSDDAAVDAVLAQAGVPGPEVLVLDHTTTTPKGAAKRVAELHARGVSYVHAPIFMSPANARAGRGIILASGPRALFERAEPVLQGMATTVKWIGERPDLAAAWKLFGNATIIALTGAVADVLSMGAELGLAPAEAMGIYDIFDPSMTLKYRGHAMARGNYAPPSFELTMARKDLRLMQETAGTRPLAVLPGIAQRMDALIAAGHGAEDMGVLAIDAVPAAT